MREAIVAAGDISTLPPDQKKLLKNALIRYADYLVSKGQKDKAKKASVQAEGRTHETAQHSRRSRRANSDTRQPHR